MVCSLIKTPISMPTCEFKIVQYVASVGSGYQHKKGAKVLLTIYSYQAIKTDSTFREKALRRELVWGVGESTRVFIQVNILKQHVTK